MTEAKKLNILESDNEKTGQSLTISLKSVNKDGISNKKNDLKNEEKLKNEDFYNLKMFKCKLYLNKENKKQLRELPSWKKINYYTLNELNEKRNEVLYLNEPLKKLNCFCIPTGKINNIVVIDFDNKEQYKNLRNKFSFNTLTIKTKNGYHLYYKYDEELKQTVKILKTIDIRNDGGFVISAPTKYKNEDGEEFKYSLVNNGNNKINKIPKDFKHFLLNNFNNKNDVFNVKNSIIDTTTDTTDTTEITTDTTDTTEIIKTNYDLNDEIKKKIEEAEVDEVKFYMCLYDILTIEVIDEFDEWYKMIMSAINLDIDKEFIKLISRKFRYGKCGRAGKFIDELYSKYKDDTNIKCNEDILKYWCNKYTKNTYFNICIKHKVYLKLDFEIINDKTLSNLFITIFGDNVIISSVNEGSEDKVFIYCDKKIKNKNRRTEIRTEWFEDKAEGNENKYPLLKNSISKNLTDFFYNKRKTENNKINELTKKQNELKKKENLDENDLSEIDNLTFKIKKLKNEMKITKHCEVDVGNQSCKTRLTKEILEYFYNKKVKNNEYVDFDINDQEDYNLHYQDGYFDLKLKEFKQRTKDNLISKTIPFNGGYKKEELENEMKIISEVFKKTISDKDDRRFVRQWFLYNLTGSNKLQQHLFNSGDGSNGKTILYEILKICFPIYIENLDKDVFATGNTTRHKSLFKLTSNPIRCCFAEEIEGQKMDKALLKEITGSVSGTIKCKQLYKQNEAEIRVKTKFNFNFNQTPELENDDATLRRFNEIAYTSKFVDTEEKLIEEKNKRKYLIEDDINSPYKEENVFYKDYDLTKKFNNEKMKISFLYYLFYGDKIELSIDDVIDFTKYKNNYKNNTDNADEFKLFIEEKYEFTDNNEDRIHKKNILDYMVNFKKSKTYNSDLIINKLMNIKYNKKFQYVKNLGLRKKDADSDNYKGQGVYKGLKVRDDFEKNFGRVNDKNNTSNYLNYYSDPDDN